MTMTDDGCSIGSRSQPESFERVPRREVANLGVRATEPRMNVEVATAPRMDLEVATAVQHQLAKDE